MQTKPWERYAAQPAPAPSYDSYTIGAPDPMIAARESRAERADFRAEREADRSDARFRIQQQQQAESERRRGEAERRAADAADRAAVTASRLPGDKEKALRDAVSTVSSLGRANTGFRDDYLGFGAGIENTAQAYLGVGTPGQRDWWADFRSTDNLVRNELFGASLTAGEKSAYAATTITPDMSPQQARQNIQRRQEIARSGLDKYRQYLLASGYGRDAIDALVGDALRDVPAVGQGGRDERGQGFAAGGSDIAPERKALTLSNVVDFATGLSGGRYEIARDGLFYTYPDGKREMVDLSDQVANSEEYRAAYRAKFGEEPQLQVSVEGGMSDPSTVNGRRGGGGFGETADAVIRGGADAVTLGTADEIAAAGRTIFGGGTMRDNLREERAVDAYDQEHHWGARALGQLGGGLLLPTGLAGAGTSPGLAALARVGAGYGGAYGAGSAEGSAMDRLKGLGAGAVTGAVTGYGLGRLGQAVSNRAASGGFPADTNLEALLAAGRQNVDLVRPDLVPGKRNLYGFLESLPFSGTRVRDDLQRGADQIEQRVADIGGGVAVPRETAGEAVRDGAERYIDQSRKVVNRLYDRAADLAGDARVTPRQALGVVDQHIAELSQTPSVNRTKIDLLNQFRDDLVDDAGNVRPLTVQAIRDLRTAMRDELGAKGLRFTDTERRVMQAIDSASQDIAGQLTGPALRAYRRADRAHAERADLVDNVVERFIGSDRNDRRSGEAIMAQIENAAQPRSGNARALERLVQQLEPGERQQVASTMAAQLGRRGTDGDNAFSPALFFSQVSKLSNHARSVIFGEKGARDLADLARIAEARGGTMGRLNNSRSGQVSNWFNAIKSVLSGGGAGAGLGAAVGGVGGVGAGGTAGLVATPALLGAAYLTARSLGNRQVVSTMLAAARATGPSQQAEVIRRLATIATREPALSSEILPIQRLLSSSIDGSRAALATPAEGYDRGQ